MPCWQVLLLIAVVPAVCEELAFRGFILSGFRHLGHKWRAIVYTRHLLRPDPPSSSNRWWLCLVGIVIGYLAVQSNSIFPGMLFHAVNNSLAVIVARWPPLGRPAGARRRPSVALLGLGRNRHRWRPRWCSTASTACLGSNPRKKSAARRSSRRSGPMAELPCRSLRARYVFTGLGPPIAGGTVTFCGPRIVAVGRETRGHLEDLGNAAILPGLVNAHTHLDLSDLDAPLGTPGMGLIDWIGLVIAHRQRRAKVAAGPPSPSPLECGDLSPLSKRPRSSVPRKAATSRRTPKESPRAAAWEPRAWARSPSRVGRRTCSARAALTPRSSWS